ncbi:hypothetical protein LWI29_035495 [Acer saccharum]|uniref:lactoylglutathione lyase n=1 Tax=Acer saccharum TaxID=4024 RepID=A0AA39RUY4_ACESA|nr:hypothetical protein LWI29_035495 [Acer saccharum]
MVEKLRSMGGIVTGEPAPVIGGTAIIAFVKDPDGYTFEVLERASTAEQLCDHVMLHHDLAMLGFADEFQNTILELTYNYGVTEYSKGNGYAQIAISTDDVYRSAEVINLVTQEFEGKITRQPGPLPGINTKITSFLDPDGWKTAGFFSTANKLNIQFYRYTPCFTSNSFHLKMAEAAPVAPNAEVLEWPKKDKRRLLHAVYRVGDLDRTIKFYTEGLGMKLLRQRDIPEEKYTNAFLGFGPEESNFVVELTYNYGVTSYDIGAGFGHFGIATQDVYKMVEKVRALGGNVSREPGPVKGGTSVIAFVKDPDGYTFELIQRGPTPEPLCQVMLRVGDLDRSIKFYEKAMGMKLLRKIDRPEYKYTLAMIGYADEYETTVLELTYNYGVTEYAKGNAYAQIAVSTDDVYKSAEVVNLVTQELGGKITRQPGPLPGINTKITAFLDPDGWKTVLVDNEDFLKELHTKEE